LPSSQRLCVQQWLGTFPNFLLIFPFLLEFEDSLPSLQRGKFYNKWELSHIFRKFPIFLGTFSFLWEFSHFYRNLKKACSLVIDYVFNNKWEFSHFSGNFPIFMGIWRKLSLLLKTVCSTINGNFPIFLGNFPFF